MKFIAKIFNDGWILIPTIVTRCYEEIQRFTAPIIIIIQRKRSSMRISNKILDTCVCVFEIRLCQNKTDWYAQTWRNNSIGNFQCLFLVSVSIGWLKFRFINFAVNIISTSPITTKHSEWQWKKPGSTFNSFGITQMLSIHLIGVRDLWKKTTTVHKRGYFSATRKWKFTQKQIS